MGKAGAAADGIKPTQPRGRGAGCGATLQFCSLLPLFIPAPPPQPPVPDYSHQPSLLTLCAVFPVKNTQAERRTSGPSSPLCDLD